MKTEIDNNKSEYDKQVADFLKATDTEIEIEYLKYGHHFFGEKEKRNIFKISLINKKGCYSFKFGSKRNKGIIYPTHYDILACMVKYDPETFHDFCVNYGYKNNSIAKKLYNAVNKEWKNLNEIYTNDEIEMLREIC